MMSTQAKRLTPMAKDILEHLKKKGSISPLEAGALYKCRSLSRRICDLKDAGYVINRELKKDITGQKYARYSLEAPVSVH